LKLGYLECEDKIDSMDIEPSLKVCGKLFDEQEILIAR
jgi:hypothetical protein